MRKPPKLCRHKNSAFIYVRKKQVYLGKWGSDEAQAAYDRYLIEWAKNGGVARLSQPSDRVLLVELVNAFLADYKARPVKSVPDLYSYDQVSVRLAKLFPDYLAEDFRVRDLELFRDSFKKAGFQCGGKKKEYSRTYLNKITNRVKAIFRWGVSKDLIPAETAQRLNYLVPLRQGHTDAPETRQRHFIENKDFRSVHAVLASYYADIVDLLRLTAMRPSELCNMRVGDIDCSGSVWEYQPEHHKTEHHGNRRLIPLGKRAQKILKKHLKAREPGEYVFTPKRAMESKWKERRRNRKSKLTPSQAKRDKTRTATEKTKRFNDKITPYSISKIVKAACQRAIEAGTLSQPWTPYELRHTAITEVREKFGAEAAQHFAGHSNLDTQKYYDHSAVVTAKGIAQKIG